MNGENDWEVRVAACWTHFRSEELAPEKLLDAIDGLAAERLTNDPAALFEKASARDSVGLESDAETLYCTALALGLDATRRPQATIQLASTLRNLGRFNESEALLRMELERCERSPDQYALLDETRAFLALTLLAKGNAVEAAAISLMGLAPHLSRYSRSVHANAEETYKKGISVWLGDAI